MKALALLVCAVFLAAPALAQSPSHPSPEAASPAPSPAPSPYVGQEQRAVKALSADEVDGLLAGAGLGFAKAAELNHYPGPKHVLQLADELGLTDEQRAGVAASFARMQQHARDLGRRLVDAEAALDRAFAAGGLEADELHRHVAEIAALQGDLRSTHLVAHLEMRALLSDHQVMRYDALRGYGEGSGGHHGHGDQEGHSGHAGHAGHGGG